MYYDNISPIKQLNFTCLRPLIGLVMGGVQSLSRSTYSKILPETVDHTSYFSFYDICEKIGIVLGTFLYGFIIYFTDSPRNSVLVLVVLFALGLALLSTVPELKPKKTTFP